MELRIGTSGWNYPSGRGTWNGIFYPCPRIAIAASTSSPSTRSGSTPSRSTARSTASPAPPPRWAGSSARRRDFEFTVKLFQKFTHPADGLRPGAVTEATSTQFKGGIEPLAASGQAGGAARRSSRRASTTRTRRAIISTGCCATLPTIRSRSSCATGAGAIAATTPRPARPTTARHGCRSTSRSSSPSSARISRRTGAELYLRAPARAQRGEVVATRELRRPLQLPLFGGRARRRSRTGSRPPRARGKKVYLFMNNHFSAQSVANAATLRMLDEPIRARMPAELVERYPELRGKVATLPRLHGYSDRRDRPRRFSTGRPCP